jgi:hypothetical protein
MTPIKQTKIHDPEKGINGNCHRACIASILECDIDEVPPIEDIPHPPAEGETPWMHTLEKWVNSNGYTYGGIHADDLPRWEGYYVGIGESPRFPGILHCVVCKDGKMVWDPHPDASGILTEETFEGFFPYPQYASWLTPELEEAAKCL